MGRVKHYAVQATVLLAILGASLTFPGIMRSNRTVVNLPLNTPSVADSAIITGYKEAGDTPVATATQLTTNTPIPSATRQASSTPDPTLTPTLARTKTALPTYEPTKTFTTDPTPAPTSAATVTPSASLLLEIVSVTSPVAKGDNANLTARTLAGAQCEITVYYKTGASKAKGLGPLIANENGNVTWTWKVGSATSSGNWRIVVKASFDGQEVTKEVYFTVQ